MPEENYFHLNDLGDMILHIRSLLDDGRENQTYDLGKYDWGTIARMTEAVYTSLHRG